MPDLNSQPLDPDEPTYCLCNQVSFGEMIGCDNEEVRLFMLKLMIGCDSEEVRLFMLKLMIGCGNEEVRLFMLKLMIGCDSEEVR